jgi:hypothetical protein
MRLEWRGVVGLFLLASTLIVGCAESTATVPVTSPSTGPGRGHGPPPHAPAHGYRAKTHQDIAIRWDSGLGVYVVIDLPSTYYLEGHYYRYDADAWGMSVDIHGSWRAVSEKDLPPGLKSKDKGKGKSKPKKTKG